MEAEEGTNKEEEEKRKKTEEEEERKDKVAKAAEKTNTGTSR